MTDAFTPLGAGVRLDAHGACPHCDRPVLILAEDRCTFCCRAMEPHFEGLPGVRARLAELAPSWTLDQLKAFVAPLPAQLAWAQGTGRWRALGFWADRSLWMGWGNGLASRKGRGRALRLGDVRVEAPVLCGLGEKTPWVAFRVRGRRVAYWVDPASEDVLEGSTALEPFEERWQFDHLGGHPSEAVVHCGACRGVVPLESPACRYCGAPLDPEPGPWRLTCLQSARLVGSEGLAGLFDGGLLR